MVCQQCHNSASKVIDKRNNDERNNIRRRRECLRCGYRYTTYERIENTNLLVRKKSGRIEEYDRQKLKNSLLKGLKKRSISEDKLERFIDQIELQLLSQKKNIVESRDIGQDVLAELKKLDKVAYLLYATVYRDFDSLAELEAEIISLKNLQ